MQGGDKGGSCGKGAREDAPPAVHTMGAAATRRAWAASSQYPLETVTTFAAVGSFAGCVSVLHLRLGAHVRLHI
eukprot:4606479-Prymnesium_polylepis.2